MYENFIIDDFLSEIELNSFTYNNKEEFKSSTGNLTLYYQKLLTSISIKIAKHIGNFSIRDAHIYDLKQPYRLHCDSGKTKTSHYTIIVPLDKQPQGGIFIMNQWADTTYSLDDYYTQDWQSVLSFEERKEKIKEFDSNISLPDSLDFKHIKDKRGFSVKEYFKYNYNQAIMFPSKFFHCSQNVENFTNKKSLAIFTDVK
jgi:hypothetical protein|tara:strand:+ start:2268 stop:2867 length:600 start_codon:yes stop_codon:yes gene_type:complete